MKIKEFFNKLKDIISLIGVIISGLFIFSKIKKLDDNKTENENLEEIKNELQKTNIDDVINAASNNKDILSGIEQQKSDYRKRLSDKLNKK